MSYDALFGVVNNVVLLLALGVVYDSFFFQINASNKLNKLIIGSIIGLIGIALMLSPWELFPGLFFDTRSILLSITGLFFGFIPAVIAMMLTAGFRIHQGGIGAFPGVLLIVASTVEGLLWAHFRGRLKAIFGWLELYAFGLMVHTVMLMTVLTLPLEIAMDVLDHIALPVMLVYPVATVLLGNLLNHRISRRQEQLALGESEERFRATFEQAAVGMCQSETGGAFLHVNQKLCDIVGYSSEELQDMNFRDITHPDDLKKEYSIVRSLMKGQESSYSMEKRYIRKDSSIVWVNITVSAMYSQDRKPTYFIGVIEDINERKRAEDELMRAKVAAENANRGKSEFLSNMSHELRTPLTSIIGYSDVMLSELSDGLNEAHKKYLSRINKSGNHLLELINNILDISMIESMNSDLVLEKMDPYSAIAGVKALVDPLAHNKNIDFTLTMSKDLPSMTVDVYKFKNILHNLLDNSMKFTQEGGFVNIDVTRKKNDLQISVTDNGIGISRADMDRIFEPFVQADGSSRRKYGGSGLGLILVKEYVMMHGGEVWVESEPGKGSTFTFTIPIESATS
ncbi:PAS domain S-box protein [Methanolobus sp. ZRKC3]|uniref:sensor histidine kinase n=1 Tax=Methanolobus sp. ZRKC3 TaxID=3125786 RepID=UPI00324CFDEE